MTDFGPMDVVRFSLGGESWAMPLGRVVEVTGRVRIMAVPGAVPPALGWIRYRGAHVPCVDLRVQVGRRAALPSLDDHFIVARTADGRTVALVVDRVEDLQRVSATKAERDPGGATNAKGILEGVEGVLWMDEHIHLVWDLDRVLSVEALKSLERTSGEHAP